MTKSTKQSAPAKAIDLSGLPARLDIRVDWAFRHFFANKKHLKKIIRDLLRIDIEVLEYLPNALDVAAEEDKKSVFDVICKNTRTDEVFVLEMQTTYESDMMDRLYYYGGSLLHNQMQSGALKYDVRAVVVCCIASYKVPHKEAIPEGKVFFHYQMLEQQTHEVFDGDKLNICFLELRRFDNYLDKDADLRKQWCWIFNNLAIFVERPEHLDPSFDAIIKDAETRKLSTEQKIQYMEALHLNERERTVVYEGGYIIGKEDGLAEGLERGLQQGREEGLQQGREEKAEAIAQVARNMLSMGLAVDVVAQATGLTKEQLEAL